MFDKKLQNAPIKVNARKSLLRKQNLYEPSDKSSSKSPWDQEISAPEEKKDFNTP